MTKTQYYTASSLDGFLADEQHGLDWLFQFGGDAGGEPGGDYPEFIARVGAIAMGAHTYEWILAHQIQPGAQMHQPWPYTQPVWVFTSRELPTVDGADIRFVRGDVRPVHEEMTRAAGERNVWVMGGGELAGQFHDQGLLDEILVTVASVTLGRGMPLMPRRITTPPLQLLSAELLGPGFAQLVYTVQNAG